MKMNTLISFLAAVVCFCVTAAEAGEINVISAPSEAPKYSLVKITAEMPGFKGNVDDPDVVSVTARLKSPSGGDINVPVFCVSNERKEKKTVWEARFTPTEEGVYTYSFSVKSSDLNKDTALATFTIKGKEGDGFLRRSKNNLYYMVFDSGKPFFGIGHNVGWVGESSIKVFDRYFSEMEKNGCNLTRVWSCDWAFPLEWKKLGHYDRSASEKLDELVALAEERGVYIMLCFDTYGNLMPEEGVWQEDRWSVNPYNKDNGGPCASPEEFFTNPEAKQFYKNRLRYIAARWGYSPNVFAIELWNEYNAPADWVREMAGYMRSVNPGGQLVTTSNGYPYGMYFDDAEIWEIDDIDLITVHVYGDGTVEDMVPPVSYKSRELAARYRKPFIITEFGINSGQDDKAYDPDGAGTELHNGIWTSTMLMSAGTAMNWWWDTYIRPRGLYTHYKALSAFLAGVNWDSGEVRSVRTSLVKLLPDAAKKQTAGGDVAISPEDRWTGLFSNEFTIYNNGELGGETCPNKYLHGATKPEMKADHIYHVDYPVPGKFVIKVGTVSQGGDLRILIDGNEVLVKALPAGAGSGPWKKSLFLQKYGIYQCIYNEEVSVDVPAGQHAVTLSNLGKDWIGIEKITLTNYDDGTCAKARCLGLKVGDDMLFWVQNRESTWKNTFDKKEPAPVKNAYFDVLDAAGTYSVEWWDTYAGVPAKKEDVQAAGGVLRVTLPDFARDVACKIRKK